MNQQTFDLFNQDPHSMFNNKRMSAVDDQIDHLSNQLTSAFVRDNIAEKVKKLHSNQIKKEKQKCNNKSRRDQSIEEYR